MQGGKGLNIGIYLTLGLSRKQKIKKGAEILSEFPPPFLQYSVKEMRRYKYHPISNYTSFSKENYRTLCLFLYYLYQTV